MTVQVPKRIDVNLVRARLGDKAAEALLMKLYSPLMMPSAKVDPEHYVLTLEQLENGVRGKGGVRIPLIFRQWFAASPRNAGTFKHWLKEQITATAPPVETPVRRTAKKRKRAA